MKLNQLLTESKTMYEINVHSVDDEFSHVTVTPITVIADDGETIVGIDNNGHKFTGSKAYYFDTKQDAIDHVKRNLKYMAPKGSTYVYKEGWEEDVYGFIALFKGKKFEVSGKGMTLWQAKQKAIEYFKIPKSQQGLLSVTLAEKNGKPVVHIADF